MEVRPYDPDRDADGLWECKRAFERGLGAGTGSEEKERAYDGKLTAAYRERYLEWVARCVADEPRAVTVAVDDAGPDGCEPGDFHGGPGPENGTNQDAGATDRVVGYVFVLPERLAMIWDAAVLNELFVAEPYRGTGVADDLLEAAVDVARTQDLPLERLVLDVDRSNDRARSFYRRHGFEHWGEMQALSLEDGD